MAYEIWDTDTANIVAARDSRDEALALLRESIKRHGTTPIISLALIFEDNEGESTMIAEGKDLVALITRGSQSAAR